ncbi:MAG: DNA polymerase I [Dehalococcoidia bacterium]|jgi:DNA polymerase-1
MDKPRLVLFDGNALLHRAFHALPPLTLRQSGEMVGAVYGFAQMLLKVVSELQPSHYAIAFDMKGPTFRHKLFDQYKAHRPATPAELVGQLGRVRQLVEAFNIPVFEMEGYEADDLLGTLSRQASQQDIETVIVTGDADAMQLVSPKVKVLYPKPRKSFSDTTLYDAAMVNESYGVSPEQIADLKGLVGDPSDNIPGVPGVGKKTALKLLEQFGSVEGVYEHIDEVEPEKLKNLLKEQEAIARQSKELATIVTDMPVKLNLDDCRVSHYDRNKVTELFRELEFASLLKKLPQTEGESAAAGPPEGDYKIVNSAADLDKLIKRLKAAKTFAFDTETTGLDPMSADLVGISLSPAAGEGYYIPVGHIGLEAITQLPLDDVIAKIKPVMEDKSLSKLAHNGKYDMTMLAQYGVAVNNLGFDSMIAAYLLGEKSMGLKALAFEHLAVEMTPISELIGTGKKQVPMSQVEIARTAGYAAADADMTFRLTEIMEAELHKEKLWKLFDEVELPLVPVLMHMERNGVALDSGRLQKMSQRLGEQLARVEKEIYEHAGHQFNINSPQQLSQVLFQEQGLTPARKTKGGYSTGAAVLEELLGVHPIVELILDYRQLSKIKSTYIDALPGLVNPKTGRLHTSFNQTRTTTGRLSSSDPNLQNIPVRGELGKEVRQAFIAPAGSELLSADYSQIDLRALAHLSKDESLAQAFRHDEDIHTATAAQVFGVKPTEVNAEMRRVAKTVNFGVIYGMSEYGLEQATGLSREEAASFINAYFEKYPGVKQYLESTKEEARKTGYVQTILGRRRAIPEINAQNRQVREAAERMAINMPVQGTSADIIKVAMINLEREIEKRNLKSRMILQVHDELIFEVLEGEAGEMKKLVPELMTSAMTLSVPLKAAVKTGANWGEME